MHVLNIALPSSFGECADSQIISQHYEQNHKIMKFIINTIFKDCIFHLHGSTSNPLHTGQMRF